MSRSHRSPARSARGQSSRHSHRKARLEHLISIEVEALLREAADPAFDGLRVLRLSLSPDGGQATVAYVIPALTELAHVQQALARAAAFVRSSLAERLNLKFTPSLSFVCVGAALAEDEP